MIRFKEKRIWFGLIAIGCVFVFPGVSHAQYDNLDQVPITQSGPNDLIPPIVVRKDTLEAMDGMKALTNVDPNQGPIGTIGGRIGFNHGRRDIEWTLGELVNYERLRTNNKIRHRQHIQNGTMLFLQKNVIHDVKETLLNFYDCIDWAANGLCIFMTWLGPEFDLLREYRWPVDMVSLVPHKGISGYMPAAVHDVAIKAADAAYGIIAGEDRWATSHTVSGITKLAGISHLFPMHNYDSAGNIRIPDSFEFDAIKNAKRENGTQAYNRDMRLSSAGSSNGAYTNVEYHVMPSVFDFLFRIPFSAIQYAGGCHRMKIPGIHFSDWPNGVIYARSFLINTFMFASDMRQKLLDPLGCSKKYARDRTSPRDMVYPHYLPSVPFSAKNCLGGNQQNLYPLTSMVQQKHFTTAAEVAYLRGMTAARRGKFTPGDWYKFSLEEDRVHWTRNKRMFNGCVKLQHSALDPHFLKENTHASFISTGGDTIDNWFVGEHWRRFRCCDKGIPFMCFNSPCDVITN